MWQVIVCGGVSHHHTSTSYNSPHGRVVANIVANGVVPDVFHYQPSVFVPLCFFFFFFFWEGEWVRISDMSKEWLEIFCEPRLKTDIIMCWFTCAQCSLRNVAFFLWFRCFDDVMLLHNFFIIIVTLLSVIGEKECWSNVCANLLGLLLFFSLSDSHCQVKVRFSFKVSIISLFNKHGFINALVINICINKLNPSHYWIHII